MLKIARLFARKKSSVVLLTLALIVGGIIVQVSNKNSTCAQGGICVVGDLGPGGGKVFYVQTATAAAPWRYLEAAPNTWSGGSADPFLTWCSNTSTYVEDLSKGTSAAITAVTIGQGLLNTKTMLRTCTFGAANSAAAYQGGGKTDWFLPSKDELAQLYIERNTAGGFMGHHYYSSSEEDATNVWVQSFGDGLQYGDTKVGTFFVRPVRAF